MENTEKNGEITESKALKVKSYRINEETADKLKELSSDFGSTQGAFNKLMECYELQKSKDSVRLHKESIERFEDYITGITNIYLASLKENEDIEHRIEERYKATEEIRINEVNKANTNLTAALNDLLDAKKEIKLLEEEKLALEHSIEETTNENERSENELKKIIQEKDLRINSLRNDLKESLEKMKHSDSSIEKLKSLEDEIEAKSEIIDMLNRKVQDFKGIRSDMEERFKNEKNAIIQDFELKKREYAIELEEKSQEEIAKIRTEYSERLIEMQEKYLKFQNS